jgi:hypothetical protein
MSVLLVELAGISYFSVCDGAPTCPPVNRTSSAVNSVFNYSGTDTIRVSGTGFWTHKVSGILTTPVFTSPTAVNKHIKQKIK